MNRAERANAVADALLGDTFFIGRPVRARSGVIGVIVRDMRKSNSYVDFAVRLKHTNEIVLYVEDEITPL